MATQRSGRRLALAYLVATTGILLTALSYGHLARVFPEAGSVYAYAARGIHPAVGFLAGWAIALDYVLIPALNFIIIGIFAQALLPAVPAWVFGLGAVTNISDGYSWGIWIVYDVMVGSAFACGGYAMALLAYIFNKGEYNPLLRPALLASLFGYTLAGASVIFDLGRWWNVWHIFWPAVHSKSFAFASRLLPPAARDRAVVVYAWCRRADDAVDLAATARGHAAVDALRRELDAIYAGDRLDDPILGAFQEVTRTCRIPRLYPEELLAGLDMDVQGTRYDTMPVLLRYCYRVAGTVGLMMCHVLGVRGESATHHAVHLGVAMQITNICRDVAEDWERGRLYLPTDLLAAHGCAWLADALRGTFPPAARAPVARASSALLDLAETYYRSGDAGIPAGLGPGW